MKKLSTLLEKVIYQGECPEHAVKDIVLDSRKVQPGDCFIAYPGYQLDGRDYIQDAVDKGASVILYESEGFKGTLPEGVHAVAIENLAEQASLIAGNFFDHPSRKLECIAVTGTNGKTSITHFLAQALEALDKRVAIMGTMGVGTLGQLKQTNLTTADAITVQRLLAEFVEQGIEYVALEASSHALDQSRLQAIELNSAHFTNLTHDHLDYHQTMESYGEAKARLFAQSFLDRALINIDDEFGQILFDRFRSTPAYSYAVYNQHADFHVKKKQLHAAGIRAEVKTPDSVFDLDLTLLGEFNLSNVIAVCAELALRGFARKDIEHAAAALQPVSGRMQILKTERSPTIIVDYAHTPDALKNALESLRSHTAGKIWTVFGCGGNRDKPKRQMMGQIADRLADHIILCDDNPRQERSEDIIEDILLGISNREHVWIQPKRDQAIMQALSQAEENDVILIAGKGHEDYQIYGEHRITFSDVDFVKTLLKEA